MLPPKNIAASAPSTENETTSDTPTSTTTTTTTAPTSVHGPRVPLPRLAPLRPPTQTHCPPLPRPSSPHAVTRLAPVGAPNTDSTRNTPTPTACIPPVVWHTRPALSRHPCCTPKALPFLTLSHRRHDIHSCTRYYHAHKHLHSRRDIFPCIVTVARRPATASAHREWPEVFRC